ISASLHRARSSRNTTGINHTLSIALHVETGRLTSRPVFLFACKMLHVDSPEGYCVGESRCLSGCLRCAFFAGCGGKREDDSSPQYLKTGWSSCTVAACVWSGFDVY